MNEHVEFSVKAEEDLYLQGSETTIKRVTAETNYSCLMLKTQRFSSLFRHYAKYHGLRKDELEYYFVNLLENEDTPESVQLQRGDTIMVSEREAAHAQSYSSWNYCCDEITSIFEVYLDVCGIICGVSLTCYLLLIFIDFFFRSGSGANPSPRKPQQTTRSTSKT